jgi:hypothetical protein
MLAIHEQPLKTCVVTSDASMAGVPAVLRYRSDDPFAVRLAFLDPGRYDGEARDATDSAETSDVWEAAEGIEWAFARDLLTDGLHTPTGEGDVHVWPFGPDDLMIELRSGAATALVITTQTAVRLFLCHAYAIVPAGAEAQHLGLDRDLERLVGHG